VLRDLSSSLSRKRGFEVLLHYLGSRPSERHKALKQICRALFAEEDGFALRVAERILRENEEKAKKFGLKTPFVVIKTNGEEEVLSLEDALWHLEGFVPLNSPIR